MHLRLHAGLHKTGTTSFQVACGRSRDKLREHGILFPVSEASSHNTSNHARVAYVLKTEGAAACADLIYQASRAAPECSMLLLSSEEFSNTLGDSDRFDENRGLIALLRSSFESVQVVCVLREGIDFFLSVLREYIEGVGMPYEGAAAMRGIIAGQFQTARTLSALLANDLVGVRYEDLPKDMFCSALLAKIVGGAPQVEEVRFNVTSDKGAVAILGGLIRMVYFNILEAESPYVPDVRHEYETILEGISIRADVGLKLVADVNNWLRGEILKILSEEQFVGGLGAIYFHRLTSSAQKMDATPVK